MSADATRSLKRFWLPVAAALAIHAALGISAAARLTTTHDEYWHLPVGLLNLKTGRFDYDNLNPPLCRMTAALPLLFTSAEPGGPHVEPGLMGWGDAFVAVSGQHYQTWYLLGRTMIVLLSVGGALVTAIWARQLFGDAAGYLAAVIWAFEPNLIAHGSLVTTDMGVAAFFVFTLFALWRFATRPGCKTALLFGGVLGLAQLAKFTSLLLYPITIAEFAIIAAAGTARLLPRQQQTDDRRATTHRDLRSSGEAGAGVGVRNPVRVARSSISRLCGLWAFALLTSLLVLNAGYLFRGSFSRLGTYDFQSTAMRGAAQCLSSIGWVTVPLPRDYVEGLDNQRHVMEQKHPVFLDGQWSEEGFPHYYLWGLFYKLPHPRADFEIVGF